MSLLSLKRCAVVFVSCVVLGIGCAALAAAATTPAAIWASTPVPLTTVANGAYFDSVSCTSAGDCVAVGAAEGGHDTDVPLVAVESGGAWGAPVMITALPSNYANVNPASLDSVSCYSTTACTAVGSYETSGNAAEAFAVPLTISQTAVTAGTTVQITVPSGYNGPVLSSIACSGAGSCTAVGSDTSTSVSSPPPEPIVVTPTSGGVWAATQIPAGDFPDGLKSLGTTDAAGTMAISCPASGTCTAAGTYVNTGDATAPFELAVTVSTPGVATSGTATVVATPAFSGTDPTVTVAAISCPSAGVCTLAGDDQSTASGSSQSFAVPIAGGTPGTPVALSPDSLAGGPGGISCSDADDCDLVGYAVNPANGSLTTETASEVAGTWGELTALPTGDNTPALTVPAISCFAASTCVLTDLYANGASDVVPAIVRSEPALAIATSSLPVATVQTPYSATLQATGGSGTNTWSVTTGSLPAGLSLDAGTGVISGTPTSVGQSGFTVQDTDGSSPAQTASTGLSITVAAAATPTAPATNPTATNPTATTPPTSTPPPVTTTVTTTSPSPEPSSAVAKIVKVSSRGTKVSVTVACAHATCHGTLRLTAVEHLSKGRVTSVTALATPEKTRKTTKTVTLARGSYAVSAQKTKTVTLTLTKAAARLLTEHRTLKAKLACTPAGATKASVTRTVVLKAASARTKRK